jgi:hypothetical protein
MDFLRVRQKAAPKKTTVVFPDFLVKRSRDLMVRGGGFYAIWDEDRGLWSTDEYDVQRLVDKELRRYSKELKLDPEKRVKIQTMASYDSRSWTTFKMYVSKLADSYTQLDTNVIFSNSPITKETHASRRLPYPIQEGATPAFDELFQTLFDVENLKKLMWAIGSIIAGDSKNIQKFFVLFGRPGTGKSTALNLIESLFPGYYTMFEAKNLTGGINSFSTEVFKTNPLIAINHEGDLSNIRDNSLLSSIVAHDKIVINAKYQQQFVMRLNAMLFIATNKPVYITDAQSGLIRRLIDVHPTGAVVPPDRYDELVNQIQFELGAIAYKALRLYENLGSSYYSRYKPLDMMMRTNHIFNFIDEHLFDFKRESWITLTRAWSLYKTYCENVGIENRMNRNVFRDELKNYWHEFHPITRVEGKQYRSVYMGFNDDLFISDAYLRSKTTTTSWLQLKDQPSLLDILLAEQPAQYASDKGTPQKYWDEVTTTLADLDTTQLHYYLPPRENIVIDFDLTDDRGNKSLALNFEAASKFPPTYAEVSKSGMGLHLHYIYDGDPTMLEPLYDDEIEVKISVGKSSVRRKRSLCNNYPVATISTGLPIRQRMDTDMVSEKVIKSERALRELILRNLRKEIHPATKPSIDFIDKILTDAYDSKLVYDVSDMLPRILDFALNSTNNAEYCISKSLNMKVSSEEEAPVEAPSGDVILTFYDVEVFPNVTIIRYKQAGEDKPIHGFINPSPEDVGQFFKRNLVGFNNRRYDNHILYAIYMGYSPYQVYLVSKAIIDGERNSLFREAYNLSYTDVYDYSSIKQSLKKWEVELGLPHREFDWDWDKPLPEELWAKASEYCDNDVLATEAVHEHLTADYHARLIISRISGLTPNHSTLSHTARIVFGDNRNPQSEFEYRDLSEEFPGYHFEISEVEINTNNGPEMKYRPVSTYRGEIVGEGGYVYAKPGLYRNVLYMDISSMHPTSIEILNLFGPYTKRYSELKAIRMAIKKGDLKAASEMFDGKLEEYLKDTEVARQLEYSLKIIINIVYGLTAARFDNPFKDPRNKDNIVAKRGALFMVDLKHELQEAGIDVIHIKTDSVKIADYKPEDIDIVKKIGKRYGYHFGVEGIFERMVLINDAVLVGKLENGKWEAVGARFSHPYVYKKLFTREPIVLSDMAETRAVQKGLMYLDMSKDEDGGGDLIHVGRVGRFYPVKENANGGKLIRVHEERRYAVTGTKDHRWLLDEVVENDLGIEVVDEGYFIDMLNDAVAKISEFGDINQLIEGDYNE